MLYSRTGQYLCYWCGKQEAKVAMTAAALGDVPREYQWMCADCIFDAVRDGRLKLRIQSIERSFDGGTEEDGDWSCYHCNQVRDRVGYVDPTNNLPRGFEFLCVDCLFDEVVKREKLGLIAGTLTRKDAPMEAVADEAVAGPLADYDKDTGAVKIDGITFSW